MMHNSEKTIEFFIGDMVRITRSSLKIEKSFYRKSTMQLNNFAVRKINEMLSLILKKHGFEYEYEIEYQLNGMIKIIVSWDNQNFDGYSEFYNVYDFDNHFNAVLSRIAQGINDEYNHLLCIV